MKAQAKVPRGCDERSDPSGGRAKPGAVAEANVCRAEMASHEKWVVGFGQPSLSRMGEGSRGMIDDPKQRRSRRREALGTSREAMLGVASRLADQVVVAMTLEDSTTSAERRTCGAAACWTKRGSSRHALGPTGTNDRVAKA